MKRNSILMVGLFAISTLCGCGSEAKVSKTEDTFTLKGYYNFKEIQKAQDPVSDYTATKRLVSANGDYMILATAFSADLVPTINALEGDKSVGYVINGDTVESNKFYSAISVPSTAGGFTTYTSEDIFGAEYTNYKLIVEEITYSEMNAYTVQSFIKAGSSNYREGTEINVPKGPKGAETMAIVDDENDLAHNSGLSWGDATHHTETKNTYGYSTKSISWSEATAGQALFFDCGTQTTTHAYVEFFTKNVGHTSTSSGETINGISINLYNSGTKVGEDIKLYKTYNTEYQKDAGNGWIYHKVPLSLSNGTGEFTNIKIKIYANMDDGEYMYIDGLNIGTIDHSAETLSIVEESNDILTNAHKYYINGTGTFDRLNYYGTSTSCLAWKDFTASSTNMMFYPNTDKSAVQITENGYIEFFMKDVGHTSSAELLASGVMLRLYNGSSSVKVAGVQDVKCYKTYNATYRTDAGNGWYRYQLPLKNFGTVGANFTLIRFSTNATCDAEETLYLDGLRIVQP